MLQMDGLDVDFPEGWNPLQANKEIQGGTCPIHEVPPFPFQSQPQRHPHSC